MKGKQIPLTPQDIKELKYQCRMGYILPFFILTIGSIVTTSLYELYINKETAINTQAIVYIVMLYAALAVWTGYRMNRNYYQDIRNNRKTAIPKIIQKKVAHKDFEVGSGNYTTLPHNKEMKSFTRYNLIIEHQKYRITKELYELCSDGDEVLFYYAPASKKLLSIEKNQVASTYY